MTRKLLREALSAKRLLVDKHVRLVGGSNYFTQMANADLQPLLPVGMQAWELAGYAFYPSGTDIMTIVPPTQIPVPNPPLTGTVATWESPSKIWGKKAALFILGKCDKTPASWGDVNEGSLGDCWLMAAIAQVARYGVAADLFSNLSGPNPPTVTITLNQQDGPFGSFQTPFPVTVTTDIPVDQSGNLVFVKSDSPGEYWPCMIEKAVAAVVYNDGSNGYAAIAGGYTNFGMGLMLPGYPFQVFLITDKNGNPSASSTDIYNSWYKMMKSGITVDVSFQAVSQTVLPDGQLPGSQGLLADHAYTLFALVDAPLGTAPPRVTTPKVKLALLRNPYGQGTTCSTPLGGEWSGTWSPCDSASWAANPYVAQACSYNGDKQNGMFWMSVDDILANMVPYYGIFIPSSPTLRAVDLTVNPLGGNAVTLGASSSCKNVTFTVATKKNADELGWSVVGTDVYVPAGTYSANSTYSTTACLEPGPYVFRATDTYGTGWNKGTYTISENGITLVPATTVPNGTTAQNTAFTVV